jgi:hypothetical protein
LPCKSSHEPDIQNDQEYDKADDGAAYAQKSIPLTQLEKAQNRKTQQSENQQNKHNTHDDELPRSIADVHNVIDATDIQDKTLPCTMIWYYPRLTYVHTTVLIISQPQGLDTRSNHDRVRTIL